ncbi:MAG: preprotein translocase subunit YajC [Burkholderiaceae bacterium]
MFISNAYAQSAGSTEQQLLGFLPIILMFVVLYFLMIRPQMKRAKDHRTMLEALKKGDEVITSGGLVGRITKVGESYVTLEVGRTPESKGEGAIEMNFQKSAVQTLLPNGTIKAI